MLMTWLLILAYVAVGSFLGRPLAELLEPLLRTGGGN